MTTDSMVFRFKSFVMTLAVAVLAVTACGLQEAVPAEVPESGVTVFVGESVETKICLGEKEGDLYPALWEKDDRIAVYDTDTDKLLGIATLKKGTGGRQGIFEMPGTIAAGTKIKVVYPADAGYDLPAEQYQSESSQSTLETAAESQVIEYAGEEEIRFSLTHRNAIVKVCIASSEFSGMKLKSVLLYSKDAALTAKTDYVRLKFRSIRALSGQQTAVFTTRPTAAASDFYLAVTLAKDNRTVTIPLLYKGKTLNAGQVNLINIADLRMSDNAVDWYNPECTRYIPEGAWCYGTDNSIVVDNIVGTSARLDVRACGDFLGVIRHAKKPAYLQLRLGDMVDTGNAGMWSVDGTSPKKKAYVQLSSMTPEITLAKDPQNDKQSVIGLFNLTDENQQIIWAYLVWASVPSKATLPICGATIMDRNLGGSGSNALTEKEQRGTLYQWGRPFPFGQTTATSETSTSAAQIQDATLRLDSYRSSAEKANYAGAVPQGDANKDWMRTSDHINDLWGNPYSDNNSKGGAKSIFDPCPKGWKVASAEILKEVYDKATWNDAHSMYEYPSGVLWPVTRFINGETTAAGGTTKGLYFADNPWDNNLGTHFEFNRDDKSKTFSGTWKANACAVRCMADPDCNDAEAVPDVGEIENPGTFSNPVIASVIADPTIWKVGEDFRITGTGLGTAFSSSDLVSWPLASSIPVNQEELARCGQHGEHFWAPDVTTVNGKYMMYVTCYNSAYDSSIIVLESEDGKHFTYVGPITSYATNGNIKDTIDPEVVTDPSTGKVWMFFGSIGGIHRVELDSSGKALAPGATFTHVAGLDINADSSRSKVFEGAYLHYRDGWWYLFASAGNYANHTYRIVVGRSRTLTGTFVDRNGASMKDGNALTLMSSASGDVLYGPGHNAEIIADRRGQDYIFYHCHCSDIAAGADNRYGCLQRIWWDSDGWPYVTGGKPARSDIAPLF